jgi:hypothetical protein
MSSFVFKSFPDKYLEFALYKNLMNCVKKKKVKILFLNYEIIILLLFILLFKHSLRPILFRTSAIPMSYLSKVSIIIIQTTT